MQVCVKLVEPVLSLTVGLDAADPRAVLRQVRGALCVVALIVEPEKTTQFDSSRLGGKGTKREGRKDLMLPFQR